MLNPLLSRPRRPHVLNVLCRQLLHSVSDYKRIEFVKYSGSAGERHSVARSVPVGWRTVVRCARPIGTRSSTKCFRRDATRGVTVTRVFRPVQRDRPGLPRSQVEDELHEHQRAPVSRSPCASAYVLVGSCWRKGAAGTAQVIPGMAGSAAQSACKRTRAQRHAWGDCSVTIGPGSPVIHCREPRR